jgi:hypothetical protein
VRTTSGSEALKAQFPQGATENVTCSGTEHMFFAPNV